MPIVIKDCLITIPISKFYWMEEELQRLQQLEKEARPIFCDSCKELRKEVMGLEKELKEAKL